MRHLNEKSYMKSLFFGEIQEELIFPYPLMSKDTRETIGMIRDAFNKFSNDKIDSEKWDKEGKMPQEILSYLAEMGLMGLAVPEELGGLGLPQTGYARMMQELASHDGSLAITLGAHQSIGYKALLLFGTEEQKKKCLPKLASGELFACYCLTEPSSGSDAASIKTKAVLSEDGNHYILTGNKLWITNAQVANFMTVFAKTDVQVNGETKEKVTCFFIELPTEGVSIGPSEDKLGIRASWTNAVHLDQVKVPKENIIGELGKGFKVAMSVLNHGRLGLAAGCIGGARKALDASISHANERVQFKKKIGEFGIIKEKISRMAMKIYAAESMVYMTTSFIDRKDIDYSLESAIAKVYATEMLWECVDENLQIWAGAGYMKEYPYERWLRDSRINRIFEGTNEILKAFIALSGLQGPGQELAGLANSIKFPLKGLGEVRSFAKRRIKRSIIGESITMAHPSLKKMAGILEEYAGEFATHVEGLLRKHGKNIHLKQLAQKRLAEIAIDFYAMSCVLSRVTKKIEQLGDETKCQVDLELAEMFFMQANRRVRGNFKAFNKNEDDCVHAVADQLYQFEKYPFDITNESF